MDSDCSTMDYSTEEGFSESQKDKLFLSDDAIFLILSKLSWEEILNARLISKKFDKIIRGRWHLLNRRKVFKINITYNKNCRSFPIRLLMLSSQLGNEYHPVILKFPSHKRTAEIRNGEDLSRYLKMFDTKNLCSLRVYVDDSRDIFNILNRSLQVGTKISGLHVSKLGDMNYMSFRAFVKKIPPITSLSFGQICFPSKKARNVNSFLSLPFLNTIEHFHIYDCNTTKIFSADTVTIFLRKIPNIESLVIESRNIKFLKSVFKKFFAVDQPRKIETECQYHEIDLTLRLNDKFKYPSSRFERLCNVMRNGLDKLQNVEEVSNTSLLRYRAVFESIMNCEYCLRNKHKIKR
uniref:F-box domain-containing protein n=1 Tax=Strongyloides papillosus TaxID=174720 RepID=A0A0N5C4V8_STREA